MNYIQTSIGSRFITSFEFDSPTEGHFTPDLVELVPYLAGVIIKADEDYAVVNAALLILNGVEKHIRPSRSYKVSEELMEHLEIETCTLRRFKTKQETRREWNVIKYDLMKAGYDLAAITGSHSRPYLTWQGENPVLTWDLKVTDNSHVTHEHVDVEDMLAQADEDDLELGEDDGEELEGDD